MRPPENYKNLRLKGDKRSKTGVLGVSRTTRLYANDKRVVIYNVVWSPERGVQKTKQFYSTKCGGQEKAFQMACEFRRKMEKQRYGASIDQIQKEWEQLDQEFAADAV